MFRPLLYVSLKLRLGYWGQAVCNDEIIDHVECLIQILKNIRVFFGLACA